MCLRQAKKGIRKRSARAMADEDDYRPDPHLAVQLNRMRQDAQQRAAAGVGGAVNTLLTGSSSHLTPASAASLGLKSATMPSNSNSNIKSTRDPTKRVDQPSQIKPSITIGVTTHTHYHGGTGTTPINGHHDATRHIGDVSRNQHRDHDMHKESQPFSHPFLPPPTDSYPLMLDVNPYYSDDWSYGYVGGGDSHSFDSYLSAFYAPVMSDVPLTHGHIPYGHLPITLETHMAPTTTTTAINRPDLTVHYTQLSHDTRARLQQRQQQRRQPSAPSNTLMQPTLDPRHLHPPYPPLMVTPACGASV